MGNNVFVRPATELNRVQVATKEVGSQDQAVHYPLYIMADENGNLVYVDTYSAALGIIDQEHLQIHRGVTYTLAKQVTIDDAGGATPVHEFLAIVPAGVVPHFRHVLVQTDGGPFLVEFFEGPTVSSNGTLQTPYNNNRNSTNTADTAVYDGPTITADGTLLEAFLAPTTKGALGQDGANEWILKAGTVYLLRITNQTNGAGTSEFVINLNWYEG